MRLDSRRTRCAEICRSRQHDATAERIRRAYKIRDTRLEKEVCQRDSWRRGGRRRGSGKERNSGTARNSIPPFLVFGTGPPSRVPVVQPSDISDRARSTWMW
ncbi:uncharacterized protein LOC118648487 [Monomorium pharaonis]|uniref:uncharacterized protein LOC118648487 n=1 Tax=Monomorium pharaonis TaxID=307658 RepID=UPI0017467EF6|nr:uncharacterized protein LOC118648487 [Monomorium pharaonis]